MSIDRRTVHRWSRAGAFAERKQVHPQAQSKIVVDIWTNAGKTVVITLFSDCRPGWSARHPLRDGAQSGWRIHTHIAARRWRDGLAPFIVVSGGYVHPDHTPYAEAIEMKKALLTRFSVPESAIVVDPHARHTTTNLRNAARLIFRMGAPVDKLLLVPSHASQSEYVASNDFVQGCSTELGYQPLKDVQSNFHFDLSAHINLVPLDVDPLDP